MNTTTVSVTIPVGENGFLGRECPNCNKYFKIRNGTGLKGIDYHICPYCNHKGSPNQFFTQDQIEYARSIAIKQVLEPSLNNLQTTLKGLERDYGFFSIKVETTGFDLPITFYREKILETNITCGNCGLVFSIYGVFSNCPDCGKLNAKIIYEKSLDVCCKKLLLAKDKNLDYNLQVDLIKDALNGAVASFDALGKALRNKYILKFPEKPKNLFQNYKELDKALKNNLGRTIEEILNQSDAKFIYKMFQVRHLYEHNAGVIDGEFVNKLPELSMQEGNIYHLTDGEVERFLTVLKDLGVKIYDFVET